MRGFCNLHAADLTNKALEITKKRLDLFNLTAELSQQMQRTLLSVINYLTILVAKELFPLKYPSNCKRDCKGFESRWSTVFQFITEYFFAFMEILVPWLVSISSRCKTEAEDEKRFSVKIMWMKL